MEKMTNRDYVMGCGTCVQWGLLDRGYEELAALKPTDVEASHRTKTFGVSAATLFE